jgi:hypothetical protein
MKITPRFYRDTKIILRKGERIYKALLKKKELNFAA